MKTFLSIGALALSALAIPLQAAPIVYGTLTTGVVTTGQIALGYTFNNPNEFDYWQFSATAGDVITIDVNRLDNDFDPAFGLFAGLFSDTSQFTNLFDGSIAEQDDDKPNPGPYGDPILSNFTINTTGYYTIALASAESGADGGPNGVFDYDIVLLNNTPVDEVPEPAMLGLFGLGAIGLGLARRRRA